MNNIWKSGDSYLSKGDDFVSYDINLLGSDPHGAMVRVYGSKNLAEKIVTLLNTHIPDGFERDKEHE